jgi:hypothetical protein
MSETGSGKHDIPNLQSSCFNQDSGGESSSLVERRFNTVPIAGLSGFIDSLQISTVTRLVD